MKKTKTKKQTEMPWATAEKLAHKILIEALACALTNSARWYKQAIALRKEFEERGFRHSYDGQTYDDLGRCPVCYKSGEQVGSWAVCREHNVRWLLNIGQLKRHQPQPLDPEQKKFLDSLRQVSALNKPPQWFGHDLFETLRFAFETRFIDAVMDHEWADKIMPKAEMKKFLATRKKEGRKINPETAEVLKTFIGATDPYGLFPERPYDTIGSALFFRNPGSDIWVFEGDLPDATWKAFVKKWDSKNAAENAELPAESRDVALDSEILF